MKQVVAALILRENRILICQRTALQPHALKWEFPGGKVEASEEPTAALRRELQEELAIDAEIGRKVTTIRHNYDKANAVELHFYLVESFSGEIQNRIFKDVRWAERKDLPKYDFLEADIAMVKEIAAGSLL